MLRKPVVYDGGFQRKMLPGDVMSGGEVLPAALATAGAGTITAAILITGFCIRTGPVGGYTDTTDTATAIIAALQAGGLSVEGPSLGDTFRFRYINTVAQAMTLAGGTGVTLGTVPATTLAASGWKDYLVTLTNTTPVSTVAVNFTTATKVITGMSLAQTNAISIGQLVTGTSVGAASVVTSIQPGTGCNVSVNATATVAGGAVTFSPTVRIDAISMG